MFEKSKQIAGECSWSLLSLCLFFLCHSSRKKMQKAEHPVQTLSQGFILINIVETDRFPVLTGILPHVREPEARDVKGLKDRPSGWRSHLVPHFFAQSTLYPA